MIDNKTRCNAIVPCTLFVDFIQNINNWYGNMTAFKNHNNSWTYHELYDIIQDLFAYFIDNDTKYFRLNVNNAAYFCACFFAIIISGKVALLNSGATDISELVEEVSDDDIMLIMARKRENKNILLPDDNCNRMAVIAQSSGTTSIAKGVMLSQKNILSDTFGGLQYYDYPLGATYYHILPYNHMFGIVADMLGPLYTGGTICFSDNKLNFFKDLQIFKPTHMNLPPALVYSIEQMLKSTNDKTVSTGGLLKKIMCAGAQLNESSRKYLCAKGIFIFCAYGLTECSPCVSMNSDLFFKAGSVGKVLPCCEITVVDGEIAVRGDNVMLGYWNDISATNEVMHDGWLYTGDTGFVDGEGFLFLTGRKSNIIVLENGEKIIPEQIESDICLIEAVKECLLTKVEIKDRIFINITIVSSTEDIDILRSSINQYLSKKNLLDRIYEIIITPQQLPKNKLGKIIRKYSKTNQK